MGYISQFEASDIDSDDIDLRFEVDGTETGTTVSIVDECGHAAQIITALLDENLQLQREKDAIEAVVLALRDDMRQAREQLEAAERSIAEQSAIVAAAEKLVRCKGRYHSELNYRALAKLFGVNTPDLPPMDGESRTVMMPEPFKMAKSSSGLMYYYADKVDKALAAAGIKVKGE
ncbi:ead/Ea22-like family protein [Salmonella enterica subsp. arizonae]|uniref:Ead/Ea22-like family protein n=2 Tax=Salmonella enterica TaxID=28901 RepID=A0A740VE74_SALET|nr:ead/Ea22-like family protein [Salmonella enterica subsp. enterica]ECC2882788.1 ead/Ea22-like family protein [Salmonella enterica subsp. arizonae]ECP1425014.1 ead/Ea22-like family protein [Salmonella enterica]HAE8120405.1 ead/Ea22-like family protein [Salmonella enterica subsp. arizonae serovar 18:z4,z32:-]HAF0404817.1 ead/Ea22-like family protein [Salmonella enterica subsp. enterica serovar 6,7:c:1,5]